MGRGYEEAPSRSQLEFGNMQRVMEDMRRREGELQARINRLEHNSRANSSPYRNRREEEDYLVRDSIEQANEMEEERQLAERQNASYLRRRYQESRLSDEERERMYQQRNDEYHERLWNGIYRRRADSARNQMQSTYWRNSIPGRDRNQMQSSYSSNYNAQYRRVCVL